MQEAGHRTQEAGHRRQEVGRKIGKAGSGERGARVGNEERGVRVGKGQKAGGGGEEFGATIYIADCFYPKSAKVMFALAVI